MCIQNGMSKNNSGLVVPKYVTILKILAVNDYMPIEKTHQSLVLKSARMKYLPYENVKNLALLLLLN